MYPSSISDFAKFSLVLGNVDLALRSYKLYSQHREII